VRAVRTWLPVGICLAGVVLAVVKRDETGLEGGVLLVAAGLSVWLLNWFYLVSVRGERDRDVEDAAREFFDAHGHWPDEEPPPGAPGPADRAPPDPHRRAPPDDAGAHRRARRRGAGRRPGGP
jgi:hypothetical protein